MTDIYCVYKKQTLPSLAAAPFPGELGQKILANISEAAWKEWLSHQTKLINEYRLRPADKQARDFLKKAMVGFLFEGESSEPAGFVPPSE